MSYLGSKPDLEAIFLGAIHLDQSIKEKEIMESVNQPDLVACAVLRMLTLKMGGLPLNSTLLI
jgi:hypothetical protein